jgi:hypothetical protein
MTFDVYEPRKSATKYAKMGPPFQHSPAEAFQQATKDLGQEKEDLVNHPPHYTSHPSGVEAIQITRHYDFAVGNAIKYLWRAGLKKDQSKKDRDKEVEDLKKAVFYINDKIATLEGKA